MDYTSTEKTTTTSLNSPSESSRHQFKVVVSTRQLNGSKPQATFKSFSGLGLQELITNDIKIYVSGRLKNEPRPQDFLHANSGSADRPGSAGPCCWMGAGPCENTFSS